MHVFLLMVWGGFFLMWPRSTLLATVIIPTIGLGLFFAIHNWASSAEVTLPPGYVLDPPGEPTGQPWLKYQSPHWSDAPIVTPSDK